MMYIDFLMLAKVYDKRDIQNNWWVIVQLPKIKTDNATIQWSIYIAVLNWGIYFMDPMPDQWWIPVLFNCIKVISSNNEYISSVANF